MMTQTSPTWKKRLAKEIDSLGLPNLNSVSQNVSSQNVTLPRKSSGGDHTASIPSFEQGQRQTPSPSFTMMLLSCTRGSSASRCIWLLIGMSVGLVYVYARLIVNRASLLSRPSGSSREDGTLSFRLENLDLSTDSECGANKCFFRLRTDRKFGYLVVPEDNTKNIFEQYKTAMYLESTYGVRQLLRKPPQHISITNETVYALNTHNCRSGAPYIRNVATFSNSIVVQRARVAPMPTLLFKCMWSKYPDHRHDNVRESFFSSVPSNATFSRVIHLELARVMAVLQQEPWLALDFQLLVDVHGRAYFIDTGRGNFKAHYKAALQREWLSHCQDETDFLLQAVDEWF